MNTLVSTSSVDLEVRVDGLKTLQMYDVCVFAETAGSKGLYGYVHILQHVNTHTPVPELAEGGVTCSMHCGELNRDPCWLEADVCGECSEGYVGKRGHANTPC
ncbi:unnamed protein product, partial [Choristocarpus tenellus]